MIEKIESIIAMVEREALAKFGKKITRAEAEVITVKREQEAYLDGAYAMAKALQKELRGANNA